MDRSECHSRTTCFPKRENQIALADSFDCAASVKRVLAALAALESEAGGSALRAVANERDRQFGFDSAVRRFKRD